MINIPSPAVSIVGRHNSGKTTLIEKLIAGWSAAGTTSVPSNIIPTSDSTSIIRGRTRTGIARRARARPSSRLPTCSRVKTLEHEVECSEIVRSMPGHDIIIVEGYRKSGLPTIEIMRSGNDADVNVAKAFVEGARTGASLGTDFIQASRGADAAHDADLVDKMPTSDTVAIVTDIPEAAQAARLFNIPSFDFDEIAEIANFLEEHYVRPRVSVVIQAGGESRRMGQSRRGSRSWEAPHLQARQKASLRGGRDHHHHQRSGQARFFEGGVSRSRDQARPRCV